MVTFHKISTALFAAVLLAGCADSPVALTAEQRLLAAVSGTYQLQSLKGQSLPAYMAQSELTKIYIASESLNMNTDGTFTGERHYRMVHNDGTVTTPYDSMHGRFLASTDGTTITVTFQVSNLSTADMTGTVVGNQLTLTYANGFGPWVYAR